MQNEDIRCGACSRKLAEGQYPHISIKCPRCGTVNHLRAMRPEPAPREGHSTEQNEWPEKPANNPKSFPCR
jgi:phage FluMu protein Com